MELQRLDTRLGLARWLARRLAPRVASVTSPALALLSKFMLNRQPELRTAPLTFVPALQDLGTASPLQEKKKPAYRAWALAFTIDAQSSAKLSGWLPLFLGSSNAFVRPGRASFATLTATPGSSRLPLFIVPLSTRLAHFQVLLISRQDGQSLASCAPSVAWSGIYGRRVFLLDDRVEHPRQHPGSSGLI